MKIFQWLRKSYELILSWAHRPQAIPILCLLATCESIFFPLPVDPLLLAMSAARPKRAIFYSFLTTFFSILGAWVGFLIGYLFWDVSQDFFYQHILHKEHMDLVLTRFQENAFIAMFLAALTPIPFKVFAIAGGIANVALLPFTLGALVGRALRFVTIGVTMYFWGPQATAFFEKHFEKVTVLVGILCVLFFIFLKFR